MSTERRLLTLAQAADSVGYHESVMRRAIHTTDPAAFPPPLKAKRDGKGRFRIRPVDLDAWVDSLEDA